MRLFLICCIASLAALATPASASTTPRVSITSLKELTVPDAPYDTAANADAQVDAAIARAKKDGKEVLIDLGGNWCADCRIMAGLMELPEMQSFLKAHYEMVSVDVGRFDKDGKVAHAAGRQCAGYCGFAGDSRADLWRQGSDDTARS